MGEAVVSVVSSALPLICAFLELFTACCSSDLQCFKSD